LRLPAGARGGAAAFLQGQEEGVAQEGVVAGERIPLCRREVGQVFDDFQFGFRDFSPGY
jgi:hypothetical protein